MPTKPADSNVTATVEKRIADYLRIRDHLKVIDDEHEKKRAPFVELQNLLTGWMQSFLEQAGADSVKTSNGTCYSSTRYTASLADPQAFMDFVKNTDNFDLLDRKANVTAVKDYVATNGNLPPGVNLSAISTVNVRRPTK